MSAKNQRLNEIFRDLGARFLNINANGSSLLTVTKVELTSDRKNATIFFTVFPAKLIHDQPAIQSSEEKSGENFEKTALEFAKRKRSEFRDFVIENTKLGYIPRFDFEIDLGEKNRQKIDSLLNHG